MELVTIGEITKHQGNKGEVRVKPLTDFPERFEDLERIKLSKGRIEKKVEIENIRYHKGYVILKFVDVDDIGAAIEHKGFEIKIPKSQRYELDDDVYYMQDIVGLDVYQNQEYLGELATIMETGANDVYVVENDDNKMLLPALKDVILEVDLEEEKMLVEVPAGLE
ncbi:ribosome maturation factor RimM [Halanaerobacter jeridensis]|uniref:Ribosome maturation factor RimM n=1 Tax=Halanaerobacter jeridensis TaxID=706427 RepID=A0A938XTL0_9FIRM|nr:ribosome maturation factor RimM [Halanaerobacter jeridensis]MBM7555317.1 16S rRNA processing protein RimM [Halanaerobacter jeridensis]